MRFGGGSVIPLIAQLADACDKAKLVRAVKLAEIGIMAIARKRGRGQGIGALSVAVVGPVIFFRIAGVALGFTDRKSGPPSIAA